MDDGQLLVAWRHGNREAGQELVRRHYKALRHFITGKVDEETAKEIAQQTFLTVCEKRDDFRNFSSFRTFLFGIARLKLVEHYRHRRKDYAHVALETAEPPRLDLSLASLLTLCEKRDDFRSFSSFRTYLFGIDRLKLVEDYRHRCKDDAHVALETAGPLRLGLWLASLFVDSEQQSLVAKALRSLPVEDQIILELLAYERLTYREIAEVMGTTSGAIAGKINRVRLKLMMAVEQLNSSRE